MIQWLSELMMNARPAPAASSAAQLSQCRRLR